MTDFQILKDFLDRKPSRKLLTPSTLIISSLKNLRLNPHLVWTPLHGEIGVSLIGKSRKKVSIVQRQNRTVNIRHLPTWPGRCREMRKTRTHSERR